jgi:fatty-acyl-CoA synthase
MLVRLPSRLINAIIEIEDALCQHPAVMAVAVVAAPDPKWGELPCALIETHVGVTLTKEDVIAHCKQLLASFKVPKIIVLKELPKTSTGKIQKFMLRDEAESIKAIDQN